MGWMVGVGSQAEARLTSVGRPGIWVAVSDFQSIGYASFSVSVGRGSLGLRVRT